MIASVILFAFEIVSVPIIADRTGEADTLREVTSRISDKDFRYVQYDQHGKPVDTITVTHEGLHMLNASLGKPGHHGLYLAGGLGVRIRKPKRFRLSRLIVPKRLRTSRYRLYVVEASSGWQDDPVYLADEALAYLAGAKTRRQLGWAKRSETIRNGRELTELYRIAVETVEKTEPEYDAAGMRSVLIYLDDSWKEFE